MSEERFSDLVISAMRAHQHGIADGPLYGQIRFQIPFTTQVSGKHSFKRQLHTKHVGTVGREPARQFSHSMRGEGVSGVTSIWVPGVRAKQLSMAATARVIQLCVCVRYWPARGLVHVYPLL